MTDQTRLESNRRYDRRRRQTSAVRHLYKTPRWQGIRRETLTRDSSCVTCLAERGERRPSTHCDHVNPHRNDPRLFFKGPFQGLCDPCHNAKKQREELEGFSRTIGLDGWPVDDRHPFNAASSENPK